MYVYERSWITGFGPSLKPLVAYNLRFPGQYFDSETGTHYNYFRDYDPRVGRYLQSDPLGLRAGVNTFGYVSQQPLAYIDPLGLFDIKDWALKWWDKLPGKIRGKSVTNAIGTEAGRKCAKRCTELTNPKRNRDEVIIEICNELIPEEFSQRTPQGADVFFTCTETCAVFAKDCDNKKTFCPRE